MPLNGDTELVLMLNEGRSAFGDFYFKYVTYFGDGYFLGGFLVLVLIWNWRVGIASVVLALSHSGVSAYMKKVLFLGTPRPRTYFYDAAFLNYVEGVEVYGYNTFPSGHTMTAFAFATFFALYFNMKWISIALLFLAVSTGLSRVYLLQHFLLDILAGSMIGVILGVLVFQMFRGFIIARD